MILAALSVIFISTDESRAEGEQEMSAYTVWTIDDSGNTSTAQNVEMSLLNALVIVSVICCMTFGIVLLYKYR